MRIPLTNIHVERRSTLANPSQWLYEALVGGAQSAAGVSVTEDSAMRAATVYACVKVLAETMASLPLPLYRQLPKGKEKATDHALYSVLHDRPNPQMTSYEFRMCMMGHLALRGNAYAEKVTDGTLQVRELWPLHPDRMKIIRNGAGLTYQYRRNDGTFINLSEDQVLHLRGLSTDGVIGLSPIQQAAKESVGLAIAAEKYGAKLFANGAKPSVVFKLPLGKTLKEEAYNRLKSQLQNGWTGDNAHKIMLLEDGLDAASIGITPEDAQLLELRKFQRNDIAAIFRVPPHMIGDLERATFSNIEQQSLEFVMYSLTPWILNWEQRMNASLLRPQEQGKYFFKFNLNALVRGDFKSRMEGYAIGHNNGWLSANDIRELEEMNPVPDGDIYLIPLNMIPADQAGQASQVPPVRSNQPDEIRARELRAANNRRNIANSYKKVFADAANRCFKREATDILRTAKKYLTERSQAEFDAWLSDYYSNHEEYIRSAMGTPISSYAEAIQAAAADEVDGAVGMTRELNQFVSDYMDNYCRRHTGSSIVELRAALDKALQEGTDQLEALKVTMEDWQSTRSDAVAQEETTREGNAVAMMAWIGAGIATVKWVATGKSCAYCRALDGKIVGINSAFVDIDQEFKPDGVDVPMVNSHITKHPPLHQGCDCMIVAGLV